MNKITTSLLAGVALAAIAVAPASAQTVPNSFTNVGTTLPAFAFGPGNSTYTLTNAPAAFNPSTAGSNPILGTLSLMGSGFVAGSTYQYTTTALTFVPTTAGGTTLNETGASSVQLFGNSVTFDSLGTAGFTSAGQTGPGDRLNLAYTAPVPEASTVISFGALLALGGLAVLRRKSVARAS